MSLKLTAESFLTGIKQSGLAEPDAIETLVKSLRGEGVDIGNSVVEYAIPRQIRTHIDRARKIGQSGVAG